MNKLDLARRLAKDSKRSHAQAADAVDSLVYRLLKDLRPSARPAGPRPSPASKPKGRA